MERITIIGHFGGKENILDGQTIKTKTLFSELKKRTKWKIYTVDTYYRKHNLVRLIFETLKGLLLSNNIIVLLSVNGMRLYFPILYFMSNYLHKNIYHDLIGGNLAEYVNEYKNFRKYISSFQYNWVETDKIKCDLEAEGITNCEVIPNFKNIKLVNPMEMNCQFEEPFKFCTFSRVMREKGIENAIDVINLINEKAGKTVCLLDIYGEIDAAYEVRFKDIMRTQKFVNYCGIVDYEKSVDTIKTYYALLFPTFWKGEGFPGTIIDALSAGLPIIASDWNYNKEIIRDGITGVLYPGSYASDLESAIHFLIKNKGEIRKMKVACLNDAKKYNADEQMQRIIDEIKKASAMANVK